MQELWKALWAKLSTDATLITMTGYTATTKTIKRGNTTSTIAFSNTVTEAVTFNEWSDVRNSRQATSGLRDITFLFVCWSKNSDIKAVAIKDYLMTLLDGANITNTKVHTSHIEYDDYCSPPYYDDEEKAWRIDLRFRFIAKLI